MRERNDWPTRRALLRLGLVTAIAPSPARAQAWPSRPVTLVVPLAAGGPADIAARIVAQKFSELLGQQFIVENIGGASGQIALNKVARARPDGYTLLFTTGSFLTVVPHLFPKANIELMKMFEPVSLVTAFPTVLVASTKLKVGNLAEFLAYAKANPDRLNFSSPGAGSNPHLAVEAAKRALGFQAAHVPYRGGGPALAAVVSGDVDFACTEPSSLAGQLSSGKLVPLAVADTKRHAAIPDVPTFLELGHANLEFRAWTGLLAPAGTPADLVSQLNTLVHDALRAPDMVARFAALQIDTAPGAPDELRRAQTRESAVWKPLIAELGLAQEEAR